MTDRWTEKRWDTARLRSFLGSSLVLKMAAEKQCRLCERSVELRPLTKHRIIPGRHGGRYVAQNVVPLCRACHDAVEDSIEVRRMIRPLLWPVEVAHATSTAWRRDWFEREYPRSAWLNARARLDLLGKLAG